MGNLSFYTTEEQIYELFSKAGDVKRVIMGLDRNTKSPCGFCFVECVTRLPASVGALAEKADFREHRYFRPEHAINCLRYISGTKLDERIIRADLDPGYKEGRQYGRGKSGGQVRDEFRADFDAGRGGWGRRAIEEQEMERARQEWQDEIYRSDHFGGAGRDVPMGEMVDVRITRLPIDRCAGADGTCAALGAQRARRLLSWRKLTIPHGRERIPCFSSVIEIGINCKCVAKAVRLHRYTERGGEQRKRERGIVAAREAS